MIYVFQGNFLLQNHKRNIRHFIIPNQNLISSPNLSVVFLGLALLSLPVKSDLFRKETWRDTTNPHPIPI